MITFARRSSFEQKIRQRSAPREYPSTPSPAEHYPRCPSQPPPRQESLDLDPRGRHSAVCLAHIFCFASAASNAGAIETPTSPTVLTAAPPPRRRRWRPSDERTQEVLRLLELGSSAHFESVEQGRLLRARGTAEGAAASGKNAAMEDGVGGGGGSGGGCGWRAFDEEGGGGIEAWILLGCVARARGDAGGAVSMFRRALALDPDCLEGECG